ncbi:hypothetical protein [Muricomes intestini]|uniref:hypothetical protein n=1 Tax=Muricomes intestini TaxID=1796634 RepID=UPI002FE0DDD2
MKGIIQGRDRAAVFLTLSILLTAALLGKGLMDEAALSGLISAAACLWLYRQNKRLNDARLICDNIILLAPSIVMTEDDSSPVQVTEEIVLSTFGLLLGSRIYKWGCDGLQGIRLTAVKIDRSRFYVTFGDKGKTRQIEFLHGMTKRQDVLGVQEKLWQETGIRANLSGW